MSISTHWGTTRDEERMAFPCDDLCPEPRVALFRGVAVQASPGTVFRWLCQMRVAPYSYDWIDNLGRRSPQALTPGLEKLELGQTVMTIFELVDFEASRHITLRLKRRPSRGATSKAAVSYVVVPDRDGTSRLLVKIVAPAPRGPVQRVAWSGLAWGDLIMMRRQLLNLKRLAEAA